jgi:hypothetical protein
MQRRLSWNQEDYSGKTLTIAKENTQPMFLNRRKSKNFQNMRIKYQVCGVTRAIK